jgi:hypothetical protein
MYLKRSSKITAVALVGIVAATAVAAGTYKLAYRLQKGQRLKYQTMVSTQQSMEMMGQEMNTTIEGVSLMHIDVAEVDKNGNLTIVYALDSLRTHVKNPQIDSTFRNPEGLLGKRTQQVISALGTKIRTTVLDTVALGGMMGQLAQQSNLNLVELPDKEVKSGDTWAHTTTDTIKQGEGKIIVSPKQTYKIGAEVDTLGYHCVRISYAGTTAIKGDGKNMGMNYFVEGEGPSSGTAYFAPKEGLLVAVTNNSDLEMTIALTGQMSMTIPQSTSTKVSVVLVK